VITVAEDSRMIVIDAKSMEIKQEIDLDFDPFALASNSIDSLAVGGGTNNVDIFRLAEGDDIDTSKMGSPTTLAMTFQSNIQRIQWVGKYVIGYAEDSAAAIYDSETEKVLHFK
jgi:hypothetical protein